jgi:hypothetical protein
MPRLTQDERYRACWDAIRRHVCAVCLDSSDDGSCGLPSERTCAIEREFPHLVDSLQSVKSGRMEDYVAVVESEVCAHCREQDSDGRCRLRNHGECALSIYLPLVVDAIEEVG